MTKINTLTARQIETMPKGKYSDGSGLIVAKRSRSTGPSQTACSLEFSPPFVRPIAREAVATVCDLFSDEECYNYFKAAGYGAD